MKRNQILEIREKSFTLPVIAAGWETLEACIWSEQCHTTFSSSPPSWENNNSEADHSVSNKKSGIISTLSVFDVVKCREFMSFYCAPRRHHRRRRGGGSDATGFVSGNRHQHHSTIKHPKPSRSGLAGTVGRVGEKKLTKQLTSKVCRSRPHLGTERPAEHSRRSTQMI